MIFSGVRLPMNLDIPDRGGVWETIDGNEYWAPTVNELKDAGIRVKLKHIRVPKKGVVSFGGMLPPSFHRIKHVEPKGGSTYILLLAPDGHWAEGRARCSRKDSYSKRKGYILAVNEALSQLGGQLYSFDASFKEELRKQQEV